MRSVSIVAVVFVLFAALPAAAKESPEVAKANALLAQAKKAVEAKEWAKAAQALGEQLAIAHKEKNLALEQAGAETFEALLDAHGESPPASGPSASDLLAAVMRALEPARHGAFVSAHALATELVLGAVERGDAAHVGPAESVLVAFAATPNSGKAGAALAKLAQGVKAARGADTKGARTALQAALPLVKPGRWLRVTLALHLEWMLVQIAGGDLTGAASTARDAAGYLAPKQDMDRANVWAAAARARLAKAPPETLQAFDLAVQPYTSNVGVGGAGGRAGDGEAEAGQRSPLGQAWAKLAAEKPFVTVKRTPAGYEVRATHAKESHAQPSEAGQVSWSQDGLTLSFADGAVALAMVDLVGNRGGPGTRPIPSPAWAWYLLAPGETYAVTKSGLVSVN